jgi:hypothetical protein
MTRLSAFVLAVAAALAAGAGIVAARPAHADPARSALPLAANGAALPVVTVYKSPSCGCCAAWVKHMQAAGFTVSVKDVADVDPMKDEAGVPTALRSCHTALVSGYTIEGHVPAELVKKLLAEHPKAAGLAVPGMVSGSPGMEGGPKQAYDVIEWTRDGKTSVYAHR